MTKPKKKTAKKTAAKKTAKKATRKTVRRKRRRVDKSAYDDAAYAAEERARQREAEAHERLWSDDPDFLGSDGLVYPELIAALIQMGTPWIEDLLKEKRLYRLGVYIDTLPGDPRTIEVAPAGAGNSLDVYGIAGANQRGEVLIHSVSAGKDRWSEVSQVDAVIFNTFGQRDYVKFDLGTVSSLRPAVFSYSQLSYEPKDAKFWLSLALVGEYFADENPEGPRTRRNANGWSAKLIQTLSDPVILQGLYRALLSKR